MLVFPVVFFAHFEIKFPKANMTVANPSNHGITKENKVVGVLNSSNDPKTPPSADMKINKENWPFGYVFSSFIKPSAPLRYPGKTANALVALAAIIGTPAKTSAGNVKKLPPPAIEFAIPAKNADTKSIMASIAVIR